jgi:hypothetical protein
MMVIHAGASNSTHVISPGPASKRRAPNWRKANSTGDDGPAAGMVATRRIMGPAGSQVG